MQLIWPTVVPGTDVRTSPFPAKKGRVGGRPGAGTSWDPHAGPPPGEAPTTPAASSLSQPGTTADAEPQAGQ
jgi:hypothetical protein